MKTVKYFILLLALSLAATQIFSQSISTKNKDTVRITSKISNKHVMLPSVSDFIYIIPPDKSFRVDTARERVPFGLVSEKYDATIQISYRLGVSSDVNILQQSNSILKHELLRCNDVNVKYFKLNPLHNESQINWLFFCDNEFFSFYGTIHYDKKFDKALAKNVEASIKSIIVTRNANLVPENNAYMSGDFSLLDLKFVKRMSVPLTYFTEDGLPALSTKGSKIVILATPPARKLGNIDIAERAIQDLASVLKNSELNQLNPDESLIVQRVQPIEFATNHGVVVEGVLSSDPNKNFIAIHSVSVGINTFYVLLGICNEDEKQEFFEKILKFKETVKVY